MESWIEFASGPLFRLAFSIFLLGLARAVFLTVWSIGRAYARAGDKDLPIKSIWTDTIRWLFPLRLSSNNRFFYSICSIIFHVGSIIVPIFLFAHIQLWQAGLARIGWLERITQAWLFLSLPRLLADALTILTVATAIILLVERIRSSASRVISRVQDILWPILVGLPFLTGFLCAHPSYSPIAYHTSMLVHILSADLVLALIPFTKIAHCVVVPFSQLISELGWRFPESSGRDVEITLGKQGQLT